MRRSGLRFLVTRLVTAFHRLHDHPLLRSDRFRRSVLFLAVVVFATGLVLAWLNQPELLHNLRWDFMLVLAGLVPVTLILNTLEYWYSGQLLSRHIAPRRALETTVIGSAANMLPIPGQIMVRMAGLKAAGATYREGSLVTLLLAGFWFAVAFVYAGIAISFFRADLMSLLFLVTGIAALAVSLAIARFMGGHAGDCAAILAIKTALVFSDALRTWIGLRALGFVPDFAQASGLVVVSVVGAAASIVPAGLAVRETLSAALAPLLGIGAAAGFLVVFLNRIVSLVVLTPIAALLGFSTDHSRG